MSNEDKKDSESIGDQRPSLEDVLGGMSPGDLLNWMPDRGRRRSLDEFDVTVPERAETESDLFGDLPAGEDGGIQEPDMSKAFEGEDEFDYPKEAPPQPRMKVEDAWGSDADYCAADLPSEVPVVPGDDSSRWHDWYVEGVAYDYISDGRGGVVLIDDTTPKDAWLLASSSKTPAAEPEVSPEPEPEPQTIVAASGNGRRWVLPAAVVAVVIVGTLAAGGLYLSGVLDPEKPTGEEPQGTEVAVVGTTTETLVVATPSVVEPTGTPPPMPVVEKILQQREAQPTVAVSTPAAPATMAFPTPPSASPVPTAPRAEALFAESDVITIGFDTVVVLTGRIFLTTDDGRRLSMTNESAERSRTGVTLLDFVRPDVPVVVTGFFRDGAGSELRSIHGVEADYSIPPTMVRDTPIVRFAQGEPASTPSEDEVSVLEVTDVDVEFDSFLIRLRDLEPNREYHVRINVPEGVVGCPETLRSFVVKPHDRQTDTVLVKGFLSTCFEVPYNAEVVLTLDGVTVAETDLPAPSLLVASNHREGEILVDEARLIMLAHINEYREGEGVLPLALSASPVAQRHAELSLAGCVFSHWDVHGLKPYMRYSLTGGIQASVENWVGTTSFCIDERESVEPRFDTRKAAVSELAESVASWYESEAHRENLLDPYYSDVAIGVAWDEFNWRAAAMFMASHVETHELGLARLSPDGELAVWGRVVSEADFREYGVVRVYYDPPPTPLSRGQLARTYCYEMGRQVAEVVPALEEGQASPQRFVNQTSACPDPYFFDADIEAPRSEEEGVMLFKAAAERSEDSGVPVSLPALRYEATEWTPTSDSSARFSVRTDVGEMLSLPCGEKRCPGVYTVEVWGTDRQDAAVLLASQSLWIGIEPPDEAVVAYAE